MLAFDLETTGLCPFTDTVTCAAVCDSEAGFERTFIFAVGDSPDEFMRLLDDAPRLCAFNGASFDLPFIQHQLGASPKRVRAWRLKLHDVFEACKLALNITFSLDALLELNGLPGKTGSGCDAIRLAAQRRWPELREYCLNDTRRTFAVSTLACIRLPKTRGGITLDPHGRFGQSPSQKNAVSERI
jgi:hypothetical protein